MPTVLRIHGWRVVVYPNDHAPAHVLGPGWVVVVNLIGVQVREVIRADERTANEVLRQLVSHQDALVTEWRSFMTDVTPEQFRDARLRGPLAESAHYDAGRGRVIVRLTNGVEIGFPPALAEGLEHATAEELAVIEVDACGLGVHVPALDADLYLPALLEGVLGSKEWMAARMGAKGGRATSAAKVAAVRENGRKGGRPRKLAAG